jgi:hypothetical protein
VDLRVLGGVLARHRFLVVGGVVVGVVLATLAYFKPVMDGGVPSLTPRKAEVWQASETLFLTQSGFPAGRTEQPVIAVKVGNQEAAVARYADPGKFTSLAPLYAKLANSDAVRARAIRAGGPLPGQARAIPTADTSYGAVNGLPMISVFATAPTKDGALTTARRISNAFQSYLVTSQADAKIPEDKRVLIEVVNKAGDETLLVPRKKTLPIVVLLAILSATVALAFIRENTKPAEAAPAPAAVPDSEAELPPAAERTVTVEHPRFRPERQRAPGTRLGG